MDCLGVTGFDSWNPDFFKFYSIFFVEVFCLKSSKKVDEEIERMKKTSDKVIKRYDGRNKKKMRFKGK